jgi:hypothetical protein
MRYRLDRLNPPVLSRPSRPPIFAGELSPAAIAAIKDA